MSVIGSAATRTHCGGGVEAALTDNLIGRIEYRYTDLGSYKYKTNPTTNAAFTSNQVMVGLGFKF